MFGGAVGSGVAENPRRPASESDLRVASVAEIAWMVALPVAVATAAAMWLLGPAFSELIYPDVPQVRFLPGEPQATPEPLESSRYLLLLGGPVLLILAIAVAAQRRWEMSTRRIAVLVASGQVLAVVFAGICIVAQRDPKWSLTYFTIRTLLVAAAIAAGLAVAARSSRLRHGWLVATQVVERHRWAALGLALAFATIWVLPSVNSDHSIAWADPELFHDTAFHFDETFAVINGLTPLSDFNAQYASLFPFLIALSLVVFGETLLAFTLTLSALTVLALLAMYGVLRRTAGSALAALLLFLPFMATSLFNIGGPLVRFTPGTYFPMLPLRYCGPYLLAWLVARHLDRGRGRLWPLFAAAGLVVLNNFEFGIVALAATIAAILWTTFEPNRRYLRRLCGAVAGGLGLAVAAYALFSLLRTGDLPNFGRMIQFSRLYGMAGFSVAPMPGVLGLPLVIYLTYVAALVTATTRALRSASDRVLTGMLAWSGLFGLGSATYYVARSNYALLPITFSAWALALALLGIVALRAIAAQPTRRPSFASFVPLFGVGLTLCSLAQMPNPWRHVSRVQEQPADLAAQSLEWSLPPSQVPDVRRFVSSLADGQRRFVVKSGAPIILMTTTGHRVADAYDVVNVMPFTGPESIHTVEQLDETLQALREAGGNTLLVAPLHAERLGPLLDERGFALLTAGGLRPYSAAAKELPDDAVVVEGLTKWVDMRHLRPEALR